MAKPGEVPRQWWLVDATDQVVGRLATRLAVVLMGKHRPTYTPHTDTGDFVVVVNAEKVKLTGRKEEQKMYQRYSGHRGGLKKTKASVVRAKHPDRMIQQAVKGMLPRNTLSRRMFSRLKVYAGAEHPHDAQAPARIERVQTGD